MSKHELIFMPSLRLASAWHARQGSASVGYFAFRCLSSQPLQKEAKHWQVSSFGRCCNLMGYISHGHLNSSGYHRVRISGHHFYVHRLVAFTFLGPPPSTLAWQVHHRDGNPSNNCLENLEWVTPSKNMREHFLRSKCGSTLNHRSFPVMWRTEGSQIWTTSPSFKHAAAELGIDQSQVSKACRWNKAVKGYEFRRADFDQINQLDGEEWRQMYDPVSGLEVPGRMVSSLGRMTSQSGKISLGWQRKEGYHETTIRFCFGWRTERVHRLVAWSFLGPPMSQECSVVNHKDLDKGNNAASNLEYVTPAENNAHQYANSNRKTRSDGRPVESRLHGSTGEWQWHPSMTSASKDLQVFAGNIVHCLQGRYKKTGGFEFRLGRDDSYEGEEWRKVDLKPLLEEKERRTSMLAGKVFLLRGAVH